MESILPKLTLLGGLALTLGCGSAFSTRPPNIGSRGAQIEKRMLEYYDPFPDRSVGPDVQSRPREFSVQRAAPRRAVESQVRPGFPATFGPSAPRWPPAGGEYPGVVR